MNWELLADIHSWEPSTAKWQELLDRLHPIVNAASAGLIVVDTMTESTPAPNQFNAVSQVLREPPSAIQIYNKEFAKYEEKILASSMALPPGVMLTDPDSDKEQAFRNRPDVKYSIEHFGIMHRFGVRLNDQRSWYDVIAFQYSHNRGKATLEEFSRLQPYIPHIAQAVSSGRMYDEIQRRYSAVLSMLDRVDVGMLLLQDDMSIVISNETAKEVIDSKSSVTVTAGNKLTLEGDDQARLAEAVTEVSRTLLGLDTVPKKHIAIGDDTGVGSLLLEISPLYDRQSEIGTNFQGVFVLLVDPDRATPVKHGVLGQLYSLTSAEQDVASLISQGNDYDDVAEKRNSSKETVRTQVKTLFQKMKVNSRSGIVRKLLYISLPFRD